MSGPRCAYRVDGSPDAPPLVLLHAIATHGDIWSPQVNVWAAHWRVVRIDLPGHGRSEPPSEPLAFADYAASVCAVLDDLRIHHAAVVGLSLGGMVAQALALRHPERVRALVLAHTSARTEPTVREIWEQRLEQFEQQGLQGQVAPTLGRWFTRGFVTGAPMTMAWVGRQITGTSPAGYTTAVRAIQALDHLDELSSIAVPSLVVAGDADTAVPPAVAERLAAALPRARLEVLRGAAHLGNVEAAVQFTETVGRFLLTAST
jgi:3-oxoadipate enol-lactonase